MLWAVILALFALLMSFLLYKMGNEILEDEQHFKMTIFAFLIVFILLGITFKFLLPAPGEAIIAPVQARATQLTR